MRVLPKAKTIHLSTPTIPSAAVVLAGLLCPRENHTVRAERVASMCESRPYLSFHSLAVRALVLSRSLGLVRDQKR